MKKSPAVSELAALSAMQSLLLANICAPRSAPRKSQVSLDILMLGNFDEKSFALAATVIATWRATAL